MELSNDQGRLSLIKFLDPGHKRFYRSRVCDYPLITVKYLKSCAVTQ